MVLVFSDSQFFLGTESLKNSPVRIAFHTILEAILYVPGIARSAPAPSRSSGSVAKLPPPAAFQVSLSIKKYSKISDTRSVLRTGFRSRYLASDAEGLVLSNSAGTFLTCK